MQNHHTTEDRYQLARAAIAGAAEMMADTHLAQSAILATLMDDTLELNDFQRHGLLMALQGLNDRIGWRAARLAEQEVEVQP